MFKRLSNFIIMTFCVLLLCSSRSVHPIDDYGYYKGVQMKGKVYIYPEPTDEAQFVFEWLDSDANADLCIYLCDDQTETQYIGYFRPVGHKDAADFTICLGTRWQLEEYHGLKIDFKVAFVDDKKDAGRKTRW